MKYRIPIILISLLLTFYSNSNAQKTYTLIPKNTGKVNQALTASLPNSMKAIAAFYSAMGGTDCLEQECVLTKSLGLGKQGSDAHKKLIETYFPDDKAAKLIIGQECYLSPSGSSSFSNFKYLSFRVTRDTVRVDYQLSVYDHGNTKNISGPDIYIFKNHVYKNIKRVLYAWTEKQSP